LSLGHEFGRVVSVSWAELLASEEWKGLPPILITTLASLEEVLGNGQRVLDRIYRKRLLAAHLVTCALSRRPDETAQKVIADTAVREILEQLQEFYAKFVEQDLPSVAEQDRPRIRLVFRHEPELYCAVRPTETGDPLSEAYVVLHTGIVLTRPSPLDVAAEVTPEMLAETRAMAS
jgi:hypothetical protein